MDFYGMSIVVISLFFLAVAFLLVGIRSVPQGQEYTVERFGRYLRTLKPGLNFVIPFIDRVGTRVNMMETVLDVPNQEVITKDNAMVTVDGVVFFQVLNAARAAYEVNDLTTAILQLTMTNVRTVMGSMDLDELLSQRDAINTKLLTVVDEATAPWGVKVTRIEIKDIAPPRDLVDSMARQMKAERDKRAAVLEAEGNRQAQILRAEGEKQSIILAAEGRKESAFRDAEARERQAQAEARATAFLSESIAEGNVHAINYFVAQKYIDAFAKLANGPSNKIIMMPMETSSLVGSLGGISELAKNIFGKDMPPGGGGSSFAGTGGASRSAAPSSPATAREKASTVGLSSEGMAYQPPSDLTTEFEVPDTFD